jgi:hypothetical protein
MVRDMQNSPFLQFGSQFIYDFADLPVHRYRYRRLPCLGFMVSSPDVLDAYMYAKADISVQMSVFSVLFFYDSSSYLSNIK